MAKKKPAPKNKAGKNARKAKEPKAVKPVENIEAMSGAETVMGRPTKYTRAIADDICFRMCCGETLNTICRDENMPSRPTVMRWVFEDRDGLSDRYARAREGLYGFWEDETLEISDDGTNDYMTKVAKDGGEYQHFNKENVLRSQLRVETRKWMLAKLVPKFRDRIEQNHKADFKGLWAALGSGSHAPAQPQGE